MTIPETIEKAVEGGYRYRDLDWSNPKELKLADSGHEFNGWTVSMVTAQPWNGRLAVDLRIITADPSFWLSLGKALGWNKGFGRGYPPRWKDYWHRFIDHLAEGKDAESFFENLTPTPKP